MVNSVYNLKTQIFSLFRHHFNLPGSRSGIRIPKKDPESILPIRIRSRGVILYGSTLIRIRIQDTGTDSLAIIAIRWQLFNSYLTLILSNKYSVCKQNSNSGFFPDPDPKFQLRIRILQIIPDTTGSGSDTLL